MTSEITNPSRRSVAKGAAWAVPAVAVAATAPSLAASVQAPPCGCLAGGQVGTFTAQALTVANLGTVTGTSVFNLDSSACDTGFFKPAYTVLGLGGTINWATGQPASAFSVGATTGVGTIGAISAFTSTFTVLDEINMPTGGGLSYTGRVPESIDFSFTAVFVSLTDLVEVECTYDMHIPLTNPSSVGGIVFGSGTVNWSDLNTGTPTITSR